MQHFMGNLMQFTELQYLKQQRRYVPKYKEMYFVYISPVFSCSITNHLVTLSRDSSVKAADEAKLMGYCARRVDAKYILGCAVFVNMLSPCVILSKVMQYDILAALTSLLRSIDNNGQRMRQH